MIKTTKMVLFLVQGKELLTCFIQSFICEFHATWLKAAP